MAFGEVWRQDGQGKVLNAISAATLRWRASAETIALAFSAMATWSASCVRIEVGG